MCFSPGEMLGDTRTAPWRAGCFFFYLLVGKAARALHLKSYRAVEEEAVANGGELLLAYHQTALHAEQVGVLPLHQQPAGVVAQVVKPTLQLPLSQ